MEFSLYSGSGANQISHRTFLVAWVVAAGCNASGSQQLVRRNSRIATLRAYRGGQNSRQAAGLGSGFK